jgi:hypothetical protein
MEICRLTVSRGQPSGALHSRVIEKKIAAAKKAKTRARLAMLSMMPCLRWSCNESARSPWGVAAKLLVPQPGIPHLSG